MDGDELCSSEVVLLLVVDINVDDIEYQLVVSSNTPTAAANEKSGD
jgi:hypothetical protein